MPSPARTIPKHRDIELIDRLDELATAIAALRTDAVRLLTITGAAGVGKTRLATTLAEQLAPSFPDGAFVIDLTTIDDPGRLDVELGRQIGIRGSRRAGVPAEVDAWLADHIALLLLDNAEHVLGIAGRVTQWLAASPETRVIVTSRHLLNVSVETELFLDTLPVATDPDGAIEAALSPAARLFLDIAEVDAPDALPDGTLAAIERACARLEGLPLAIELVAARVPELTEKQLDRIAPENAPDHDIAVPEVRAALQHAVEWSYRLLSPGAQQLLRYLAVCVDNVSLEIAEYLAEHAKRIDLDGGTADALEELVAHHLILPVDHQKVGVPLFRMPALVAAFARHRLAEAGEEDDARRALALAMTSFATQREWCGLQPGREHEIAELDDQIHSTTAALDWFRDHDDTPGLLTLVARLSWFWYAHGFYADALAWFEEVLRRDPPRNHSLWGQFLTVFGTLLDLQHEFGRAREILDEAWAFHESRSDTFGMTTVCMAQGIVAFHQKRHGDADRWLHQAIDLAMRLSALPVARSLEGMAWENLGANAHEQGALDEGKYALRQAIAIHERSGYLWGRARALCDLGNLLRDSHNLHDALAASQAGIAAARHLGDPRLLAAGLAGVATILTEDNQARLAAWIWGAVDALQPAAGDPSLLNVNTEAYRRSRLIARRRLGVQGYGTTIRRAAGASLDQAIARASTATLKHERAVHIPTELDVALTNRERDVLELIVEGLTTDAIADTLGITERTVSSHIGSLLRKFDVTSRLELISAATPNT